METKQFLISHMFGNGTPTVFGAEILAATLCNGQAWQRQGPLFGIIGVHYDMVRFCWAHNLHLGIFHKSNASALRLGSKPRFRFVSETQSIKQYRFVISRRV